MKWTKKGFEDFRKGTFGNGGQNLYVSAGGTLQRLFNFDLNGDGYFDLPIANSHSMWETPPVHIYDKIGQSEPLNLPSLGSFDALFCDLDGDGTEDLVIACQHDGVHTDVSAMIYYGSEIGLSERYCRTLRVTNSLGVAAGDFNGSGKKALAFLSGNVVRIFYQSELGIEENRYTELAISGISLAAADLDGDGYDDLYVIHQGTGEIAVYWGGEDGINVERRTVFGKPAVISDTRSNATTEGRKLFRWVPWRCNIVNMNEKPVTFRAEDNCAVFASFDKDRNSVEELRVVATETTVENRVSTDILFAGCGPMHAVSGDLRGDGSNDIVIAVATDFNAVEDMIILWEKDDYSLEKATRVPIRAARSLSIGKMEEDGKNYLFVCQACTDNVLSIETAVFSFDKDGNAKEEWFIPVHEAIRIISGKTYSDGRYQLAVVNHEGETKLGFEDVYVFLGGEDGFEPERRIELPGCAAVDCMPIDFNDDGNADLLVVNCAENAPSLDPGSVIFWNKNNTFNKDDCLYLDTYVGHGCAVGDFRHTGYLDMVFTAIADRQLTIIEGGPDGWGKAKKITLGGHEDEVCVKSKFVSEEEEKKLGKPSEAENQRMNDFASPRWLFTADFNGDGWLDLFVPQINGPRTAILWGGPDGFSWENRQELATGGAVTGNAADLDGDGYLDLICSGFNCNGKSFVKETYITIYWGSKDGYSDSRKTQLPAYCSNDITVNDFNGDGRLDFFTAAYHGGRLRDVDSRLYFGSEDKMFHRNDVQLIRTHSATGALSGDFNGDGYIDLAVASHKTYGNHVNDSYVYWGGPDGINEERCTKLPCRGPHGICTVDVGNIVDRSDSEYYTSEAFKSDTKATKVSWKATNGKKTWVKIQLRCAESIEALEMADWSESFENGADISALNLKGYVQYNLELGACCGIGTPRITEVTVDFE